ncbi:MAG: YccF domain-containing protein [Clostridia bacterium]|nr:YccF domain-containing protein [Clostridia bacterium]
MSLIGNIIWIIFGGLMIAIEYIIAGIVMCLTIIGIPFGYQSMKLGVFALFPFGQKAVVNSNNTGCLSALMNVIWFFIGGIWIVLTHLCWGVILCITIVGIPFGMQHFKLMTLALAPFGRDIVKS